MNEIKISEQAVLVEITMTKWANRITDKYTAGEISERKKSREGSTRVSHDLTANAAVKKIATLYGHINNNIIKKYTLSWAKGTHLLPAEAMDDFERDFNKAKAEWDDLVKQVGETYDKSVEQAELPAPHGLGKLFNRHWFPPVEEVVAKYSIELKPYRLLSDPDHVNDIRVNLPQEKLNKMREAIEQENSEITQRANEEVLNRIVSTLQALADGLDRHGKKEKGAKRASKFSDNTVEKINELADVAKKLNVTGDARINAAVDAVMKDLTDLQPDELREDKGKREKVRDKAQKIVDDLCDMF